MTVDRVTGARLLRRLRERRGWSSTDLARAVLDTARRLAITSLTNRQTTNLKRTIGRWERQSNPTRPGDRYQLLLAHVYARHPAGHLSVGPASEFSVLLEALRHFGADPDRIQQLAELVGDSGDDTLDGSLTLSTVADAPLDARAIASLRTSVTSVHGRIGEVPFARLQLELAPIVDSCRRALTDPASSSQEGLAGLAIFSYRLAGRLGFETRDDETALARYADATGLAGRLRDRSHRAAVQASRALVTLHVTRDAVAARAVARSATVDAHKGQSYGVRAKAHAVYAEACARAGDQDEASRALDRAWRTADQLDTDEAYGHFDIDRLNAFTGLCALYGGDVPRAHDYLTRSYGALNVPRDRVQRCIVGADLALARLRGGDPAAAVALLHDTVDATAAVGARVPARRIRQVRRELRPWRAEGFLAELDDHLHDTLLAP